MAISINFKDFARGVVLTAPSPTDTGVALTLREGQGDDFPEAPFDATFWPPNVDPSSSNAEICLCTEKDGDILHITRHQRGTSAQHILAGWQVMNCIDAELLNEIIALASGADGDILDQVSVDVFTTTCGPSDTIEINGADILPICSPDGDGTNPFVVSFVAPASGQVELWAEMEIFVEMFNLPSGLAWCFADAETGMTPVSSLQEVNVFADVFGDAEIDTYTRAIYHAFVRDLTPGNTYNWQLSGYTLSGSAAVDIRVNDGTDEGTPWGPAVVTVQGSGGGGSGGGGLESVVAGSGIAVDDTDPLNPVISSTGGGGGGGTSGMLAPVVVASTSNAEMTESPPSGPATIDTTTVEDDWRVLLTNQSTQVDNGVWVVNTSGLWTRPDDFATGLLVPDGLMVAVGEVNGSWNWASVWMFQGGGVIVDTDPNSWAMVLSNVYLQFQPEAGTYGQVTYNTSGITLSSSDGGVGITIEDGGSSGITINSGGTGPLTQISNGGISLTDNSATGLLIEENGNSVITIQNNGEPTATYGIQIIDNASPDGILISSTGSGDGGITVITQGGAGGVNLISSGTGAIDITNNGTGSGAGINLQTSFEGGAVFLGSAAGINLQEGSSSGISLSSTDSGNIVLSTDTGSIFLDIGDNLVASGIPTADPHVVDALWSNAGIVTVSAG